MNILGDYLLVKKDKYKENTIIMLKNDKENMPPFCGDVVEIGKQIKSDKYKKGMKIMFTEFGHFEFDFLNDYSSKDYYILVKEESIIAIVNDKNLQIQ